MVCPRIHLTGMSSFASLPALTNRTALRTAADLAGGPTSYDHPIGPTGTCLQTGVVRTEALTNRHLPEATNHIRRRIGVGL